MKITDALENFLHQKKIEGLAEASVSNYKITLELFVRCVRNLEICELTYETVTNYILGLYEKKLSRASVASYVRNIRIFLRWVQNEYGLGFESEKIKVPKSPKKVVHIYSDGEIKYIFEQIHSSIPWITARNASIVSLMLDSGIRQCEVCNLKKEDVDRERRIMRVCGKGAKERMVPIGQYSIRLIDRYLEQCPYKDLEEVYVGRGGKPMTRNAVKLFTYRLEKNLPFRFSSHRLRHNYATNYCIDHVREMGKTDVYDLSILMGHESIETTKRYEHFAHEILAVENSISHLDGVYGNERE